MTTLFPIQQHTTRSPTFQDSFLMTCWTTVYPGACSTTFRGAGGAITSPPYRETVRGSVRTTSPSSPAGASLRSCPARMRRASS